jgi:hypothetical protein
MIFMSLFERNRRDSNSRNSHLQNRFVIWKVVDGTVVGMDWGGPIQETDRKCHWNVTGVFGAPATPVKLILERHPHAMQHLGNI